jgi:hypothetical protein
VRYYGEQIMVDDVAAIVIMLTSPPANAAAPRPAPKKAARAQATNSAANSVDAKADRDALSALPYMNFFRHLELVCPSRHCMPAFCPFLQIAMQGQIKHTKQGLT